MKLSLGPVQYYWPRNDVTGFYEAMLSQPLDVIYLGEVVCGKRHQLRAADWIELAHQLAEHTDKQIVLSTLTLLESNADLSLVKKLCSNGKLQVEANDMAAVQFLCQAGLPFTAGPAINIYNQQALAQLMKLGLTRWVVPVEMGAQQLAELLSASGQKPEIEVLAYGHLPLAYSARCFTARHLGLDKDNCDYRCIEYPHGLPLNTQEDQQLFVINGIATLSGEPVNLLSHYQDMADLGVDILRLSPQWLGMDDIINAFDQRRQGAPTQLSGGVDGYWRKKPGLEIIARA